MTKSRSERQREAIRYVADCLAQGQAGMDLFLDEERSFTLVFGAEAVPVQGGHISMGRLTKEHLLALRDGIDEVLAQYAESEN